MSEELKFWANAAQWLVTGIIALVLWTRKPGEDNVKEISALGDRTSRLEETMKHVPTNEELASLRGELRECSARVESVVYSQTRITVQLDRIESFLHKGTP